MITMLSHLGLIYYLVYVLSMSNLCLIDILSYLPARLTLKVKVGTYRRESWRVSENKGFGYRGDDVT